MSFYQVEDIVEDAIHLVYESNLTHQEQRSLLFNLYKFQSLFDTSYTHLRVYDILKEIRYVYEWPLEKHPDYLADPSYFDELNPDETYWVPTHLSSTSGSVYIRSRENQVFLYFDAGDSFWERVRSQLPEIDQEAPQAYPLPVLLDQLMQLGKQAHNMDFVKRCYASFANAFLEYELGEEEGFPIKFSEWLEHNTLLSIRTFAETYQSELTEEDEEEFYCLPDWESEVELAESPDRIAQVSFWLKLDSPLKAIKKAYMKELGKKENPDYYDLAYTFFRERLDESWQAGIREFYREDYQFSFWKKIKEAQEEEEAVFATLIFQLDKRALQCKIGIQNGLILDWQQRAPSPRPEYQHFIQDLLLYLEEEEIESNKFIGTLGEWKYELKKSSKWLSQCLESAWKYLSLYSPQVYEFYSQPFSLWGQMQVEEVMKNRDKALKHCFNFFGNEMDFKLALAYWHHTRGNKELSAVYLDQVTDILEMGLGSSQLQDRIRQGIACMDTKEQSYPEVSTFFSIRLRP